MDAIAAPYVIARGASRREGAILDFKACAADTGGRLSVCEFTLGPWESGPVRHVHTSVDEALIIMAGRIEAQLGDERYQAEAGGFIWMPRGIPHAFANAGPDQLVALALALPGGLEELFAEQVAYMSSLTGPPDPEVLEAIGARHGAPIVGPPIVARDAPTSG